MKPIIKTLKVGVHTLALPLAEPMRLEELFDKALTGATIEKLDNEGNWLPKETIRYTSREKFLVSSRYALLYPLDTIRLTLKRNLVIDWAIDFESHRGLMEVEKTFPDGFNWDKALFLAQLSLLVYEKESEIEEKITKYYHFDGFYFYSKQTHKRLFKKALSKILMILFRGQQSVVDLQFMTLLKKNLYQQKSITIIFRGSNELEDWITNLRAQDENFYNRGYVHQGFYHASNLFLKTAYQEERLNQYIRDILSNNTKVILAGHSLGGTMATLIGCHLLEQGINRENIEVYTFGTPPIGDQNFCNYYQDKLKLYRLVNENDVVAHLDKLIRFKHFGEEILLPSNQGEVHSAEGYIDNIIDKMGESLTTYSFYYPHPFKSEA